MPGYPCSALIEAWGAKRHDPNGFAKFSALAYSPGGWKHLNSIKPQTTDENQVRMAKASLHFLFISGCTHLVAASREQSFYPISRLFHLLNYKNGRPTLALGFH